MGVLLGLAPIPKLVVNNFRSRQWHETVVRIRPWPVMRYRHPCPAQSKPSSGYETAALSVGSSSFFGLLMLWVIR